MEKKRVYKTGCMLFCLLLMGAVGFAQEGMPSQDESMEKLSHFAGEWQGDGWMMMRNGEKNEFTQTELVEWKLDNTILVIEGEGKTPEERKVHQAFGIISAGKSPGEFTLQSYLATGQSTTASAKLDSTGQFIWWFEDGRDGTIRYTTIVTKNTWTETGEYSRDGETWRQFLGMELQRMSE
ncbi:MAG: hypothetical protein K9N46_00345 [Candidatus Marinimicrobia bacterium]|nr:hypothetical protein [Candidatus Neomarinimicrobiota bacterium]MCF7829868.1 hypothetical protein [Candidatus Neomarinimicrobiota bacterium]MCF7879169.1 hypothetical protein [Candidatus Neomarinimicrobiota bacterium]